MAEPIDDMAGSKRQTPARDTPTSDAYAPGVHRDQFSVRRPDPGLHLVATPIGDLADITLRALETLHRADLIACEDTRVTATLLRRYGINTPMRAYHEHNAAKLRPRLIETLTAGGTIALVSDAGTPLISDPGYQLVADARTAGIAIHCAPGPSAVITALCLAGQPTDSFTFTGFLPAKAGARNEMVGRLRNAPGSLVLFESARRLPETMALLAERLGDRPAAICREMTKLHEEIRRDRLPSLAAHYADAGAPRGEVVIVIGPATEADVIDDVAVDQALVAALAKMSVRDAADAVATALDVPRRRVYGRALSISAQNEPDQ